MKNNIYKGYIASRQIHELQIPQRIQNMVIRLYCEKRGKIFGLSATEYIMDHCYMMLKALAQDAKQFEAVVFYSMFMLPAKKTEREFYYRTFIEAGTEIHFAYEEFSIKTFDDVKLIEDILIAKELTKTPQELPTWP